VVIEPNFATERNKTVTAKDGSEKEEYWPYLRDEETLARPWAIPGTPGLEHRIGGLEKGEGHGNISYDPANHDLMVRTRQAKVDRIADSLPPLVVDDPSAKDGQGAKVLVPEMNLGQLSLLLRGKYLVDAIGYNQVNGMPIKAAALAEAIGGLVAEAEGITVDLTPQEASK
jgi:2-oxoglutarate ferredoxin oxidoreductase subunit alpha